ncbi:helix-turn-helix domain-containing protein [Streptomyces sp. 4N509B]|uniref:helix-turn-helix domain-containing protein n=1 Tax=Streptomyces sp. 4N509B TaxID=3457413 RepID=UPI003FD3D54A
MPARTTPTARQRRLGAELRRMRDAAGLGGGEAAERLGIDRTRISNMEAGRTGVSAETVRSLASVYDCADRAYVDALAAMAEERGKGWWEEYRGKLGVGALDLAELEAHATAVRSLQVTYLPGLLQTESFAKAVLSTDVPEPMPSALRCFLSFRMKRRDVLDRDDPPSCVFLIHEAALRLVFGGTTVMREQLRHILDASERENVTVRVIPFSAGGFPHAGSVVNYFYGAVPALDTVQFDTPMNTLFLDAPAVLNKNRCILDRVEMLSLNEEKTRDFVRDILRQL